MYFTSILSNNIWIPFIPIVHISKLGKCIYTNKDYSTNYNDLESHLTSLNLNSKIYDKNPFSLFDLKKYLGEKNDIAKV